MVQIVDGVVVLVLAVGFFFEDGLEALVFHSEVCEAFELCLLFDVGAGVALSVYLAGDAHPPEYHLVAGECACLVREDVGDLAQFFV